METETTAENTAKKGYKLNRLLTLKDITFTYAECILLVNIANIKKPLLNHNLLAQKTDKTKQWVRRTLNKLAKDGWLEKTKNEREFKWYTDNIFLFAPSEKLINLLNSTIPQYTAKTKEYDTKPTKAQKRIKKEKLFKTFDNNYNLKSLLNYKDKPFNLLECVLIINFLNIATTCNNYSILAKKVKRSDDWVRRTLNKLAKDGWLEKTKNENRFKDNNKNIYIYTPSQNLISFLTSIGAKNKTQEKQPQTHQQNTLTKQTSLSKITSEQIHPKDELKSLIDFLNNDEEFLTALEQNTLP